VRGGLVPLQPGPVYAEGSKDRHLVPQYQQFDVLAPPSRANWVNICSICRSSWYTSEALMAWIVTANPRGQADNAARQRAKPGLPATDGEASCCMAVPTSNVPLE
jgi:hypothetical protein